MQQEHDLYCDRRHPARQRCNDALAPAGGARPFELWPPTSNGAETTDGGVTQEEIRVDVQRETIAAKEVPEPTPYAAREWQSTVAALEVPAYLASEREHAMEAAVVRGGSLLPRAAVVVAATAVVLLLWSLRRPRLAEAPEGGQGDTPGAHGRVPLQRD